MSIKKENESDDYYDGTVILERMAEAGYLDTFWEAVDLDDFSKITLLMRNAGISEWEITETIQRITSGDI